MVGGCLDWVVMAASRMSRPQRRLGEFAVRPVKISLMLLIQ